MQQMPSSLLHRLRSHECFPSRESQYLRWYPKQLSKPSPVPFSNDDSPLTPTGIYIHVPFCERLCKFCPFNKRQLEQEQLAQFVESLVAEISLYRQIAQSSAIQFVYFGGGTPSVLTGAQISTILDALRKNFGLSARAEITLEIHPTHITRDYLKAVQQSGINRLSSGIQSFDDAILSMIGAQHTAGDSARAISVAGDTFGEIAIDLLFRCPSQSPDHWRGELQRALSFQEISHFSLYSLVLKTDRNQPSLHDEAEMTVDAMSLMQSAGFEHYASCASGGFDFARAGRRCVYEAEHWAAPQAQFIGLGPGAWGYLGSTTTVNALDLGKYTSEVASGRLPLASARPASRAERMHRYFVLGVKTLQVPLAPFRASFEIDPRSVFRNEFSTLDKWGFAQIDDSTLTLTDLGRLFVDEVSSIFFSPTERDIQHPEEPEIRRRELENRKSVA
jgi:oxygen-independent coproporphyrinogen-3 oxidase